MRKTVCLVGRPNTGKSSLFNRMVMQNKAIISDHAGTTRDRLYGIAYHNDKSFNVIDTGGIDLENADFNANIKMQAELAIDEADVIVFVVDGKEDLTQNDFEVRNMLMRTDKKVIVAVNKIDNPEREDNIYNFYELGFEHIVTISVEHKRHITELLDMITEDFPSYTTEPRDSICRFSLIGRPNVGKSSLVNAILGEERQIVSDVQGTTRDASDTRFTYNHEDYIVVDTAGIRKRGKIYEELEKYSLIRGFRAIERSDVCCVVIDAEAGIIEQDKHIVQYALDNNKAIVLVVNKWDTVKNKDQALKEWKLKIQNEFQFIPYVRTVFLSAKEKPKVPELMDAIIKAYESFTKEVKTSTINDIVRDAYALHMAPSYKKNRLKIFFVTQTDICPPRFTFNVNNKNLVHFSYHRYLENKIRENIDLEGTPIVIQFKNKSE
ncbi:MAG: ribosome biogenesis GTPase Der [Bacilli bacterium]|nr:ribosome biogenesis GTPase Der [Bacilli bacterium]